MRVPEKPVAQPLTYMWERHKEMSRRIVVGDRPTDIAADMGISRSRLSIIMNSPIFRQHTDSLSERTDCSITDIKDRIFRNAPKALDILEDVLMNEGNRFDTRLQVKVAHDLLDRGGLGAVQKSEIMSAVLTADDILKLRERKARVISSQGDPALFAAAPGLAA